MTPLSLQLELEKLLKDIFAEFRLPSGKSVNIYKQDIPLDDMESPTEKAPLIVILMSGFKIEEEEATTQPVDIRFEFLVKDDSDDLSGYQDLLIMGQKIAYHFVEYRTISNAFEAMLPITFTPLETEEFGVFVGVMDMAFTSNLHIERREEIDDL